MRVLFFVVAALAALYGGYWFWGSWRIEAEARGALAGLAQEGWEVGYDDLSTRGFPSRFDTTVTGLRLASPDGRFAWETPFLQVLALSYRPGRFIAVWPPEQAVAVAGRPLTLRAEGLRASGALRLGGPTALDHATVESGPLTLAPGQGPSLTLDRLLGALREAGPAPGTYDLYVEAAGLGSPAVEARLDLLRLDAQVALDAPLDAALLAAPAILGITLREARLGQGEVALRGSGSLAPDARGYLAGELRLSVEGWRGLLDLLEQAGLLPFGRRVLVEGALDQLSDGQDDIELPLTLAEGEVRVLGLPILAAPRL